MDIRTRIGKIVIALLDNIHERRKLVLALSCAVVFITTYILILPAFTLEKDEAAEQGGIDVPAAEQSADAIHDTGANSDESADADSGEVSAGKQESADTGPPVPVTLIYDESKDYSVAVEGDDATLSEDMSVDVREIDCGSPKMKKEYDALYFGALEAVQKEEGSEKPSSFAFAKFYDITLLNGKNKVQPGSPVDVKISFSEELQKDLRVKDPDRVHIVHFAVDKETGKAEPEVLDPKTTSIALEHNKVTEAAFTADSFSVFAVVCADDTEHPSNVLTADGDDYRIKVTYDDDAKIPEGTELIAKEIDPESDEYLQHLGLVWTEANKEYNRVEEMREHYDESMGELPEAHFVNINTSRFFDISLQHDGSEIQPETPVQVEISYDKGLRSSDKTTPGVVTYDSDKRAEILEDTNITVKDGEAESFGYEQKNITAVGTFVGQETSDFITEPKLAAGPDPEGSYSSKNVELSDADIDKIIRSAGKKGRLLRAAANETPSSGDDSGLEVPTGSKTLKENLKDENDPKSGDGTYTLTLSVKGHSRTSSEELVKKSNVLIVMDRSSSMVTNTIDNNESYWLHDGTEYRSGLNYYGKIGDSYIELNRVTDWQGNFSYFQRKDNWQRYYGDIYVRSKTTRFAGEQEALSNLFAQLLGKNGTAEDDKDIVEISVISFADQRYEGRNTEVGWTDGRDTQPLIDGIISNQYTSGTNWEDALMYAKEVMDAKKASDVSAGKDEDYYVVFLTDGEPTAYYGETGGAHHYDSRPDSGGFEAAYKPARDDAAALVNAGYKLYNIFTYGNDTDNIDFLRRLTNYAYTNGADDSASATTNWVRDYFVDARTTDKLVEAFNNIFTTIETSIGHANVSITDTLTTDAMTTTVVHGKTNGYVYKVTKPDPDDPENPTTLYTVTATGDLSNPAVTFNVPGSAIPEYTAEVSEVGEKKVYSVTTAEGKTYKMALADVDGTTGDLVWDLAPIGVLMDDCTYSVSFIVWPDQDAYDYVAALNNGLTSIKNSNGDNVEVKWDDTKAHDSGKGYMEGGVDQYPSIVKYPNGTYAVLTNKDQKLHYSVVETVTDGTTTVTTNHGPYYSDLPLPDPMPLTASQSSIEKVWNVARDPDILAHLLYGTPGEHYSIGFDILQDGNETPYTSVSLGWDEDKGKYIWESDDLIYVKWDAAQNKYVACSAEDEGALEIGTRWAKDFSIATGHMLSEARMDALGMDKSAYPSGKYPADADDGVTYYILEEGHDYTIVEPDVGFEFDFSAPLYHPMIVDGVLQSVNFTRDGDNVTFTDMTESAEGLSSLRVENTLRGYINLRKKVVDSEGSEIGQDKTKFVYAIELTNADGLFKGDDIPWYGVNNLFYHDADWNYYQAEKRDGNVTIRTETGGPYDAVCEEFDPNNVDGQTITFNDGSGERSVVIYGNRTSATADGKKATAEIHINQDETVNIANVPEGTTYNITEADNAWYELKKIETYTGSDDQNITETSDSSNVEGEIVPNDETNVTYYNEPQTGSLKITKFVKVVDQAPSAEQYDYVDGNYIFSVSKPAEGEDGSPEIIKYVQITVAEGKAASYKVADTESALETAESHAGSSALVKGLDEGDYIIEEVSKNGLMLTRFVRGDNDDDAVNEDDATVTVHVRVGDVNADLPGAQAEFTNTYYNNDGPDKIALDIVKVFEGISSLDEIPAGFEVVVWYTYEGSEKSIILKKDTNETNHDGVKITVDNEALTGSTGIRLIWHITNVPNEATGFKIKEVKYDEVTGYDFDSAFLNGSEDITETAGDWHDLTVTAPEAELQKVTSERNTSDSPSEREYILEDGDILLSKLTGNEGTLVISKTALNTVEREAVKNGWPQQGGFKKNRIYWFSIEEHPNGFGYGGKTVTFSTRESDGKTIVTFTSSAAAQEEVFAVTYDSHAVLNNAEITNSYTQIVVALDIVKVEKDKPAAKLSGAEFTLRKLTAVAEKGYPVPTQGGTFDGAEVTDSPVTTEDGEASFGGLIQGYYELTETKAPAGYVLTDDAPVYFKVDNGVISWIEWSAEENKWIDKTAGDMVSFEAASEAAETNAAFTVENEPGAALPSTGGIGTTIFYTLGSMLAVACVIALIARKRLRRN